MNNVEAEKAKIEAYKYLDEIAPLPHGYFEQSKQDFETGGIFRYGVPAVPEDGERALNGLTARINVAIAAYPNIIPGAADLATIYEIYSLKTLSVLVLTLRIPEIFSWQISDQSKGFPALLLGTVWQKEPKFLPNQIKRAERERKVTPETIAAFILTSPLDKFEKGPQPLCEAFYKWLLHKAEWRAEKETRELSLDTPMPQHGSDDKETTLLDVLPDSKADSEIVQNADIRLIFQTLLQILPPKEKAAVTKFTHDEILTPAERRAKDRAVIKMKKHCEEHGIEYPG